MKLLEEIKRDHDKVGGLFLQIENKEEQGPKIFNLLVTEVLAHHQAEEQTVFGQIPDDKESKELRLELIAEHDSLRRAMQVVLDTDPEDDNWKARFAVCKDLFLHHIQEEENELFEKLRQNLTEPQMNKVYEKFASAQQKSKPMTEDMVKKAMILRPQDFLPKSSARISPSDKKPSMGQKDLKDSEKAKKSPAVK